MPVFNFQHESTGEVISVLVKHTEPDESRHVQIQDGKTYKRVYAAPMAAKDTKKKDCTSADFTRITAEKNLKVGEMWEISREMSQERASKNNGVDIVQENFYKDYEKKNGGKHQDVIKREELARNIQVLKEFGVTVEV